MEVRTVHRPQKTSRNGSSRTNRLETEKYAKACSPDLNEIGRQDGIDLIGKVIDSNNLFRACEKVKANKGAPGIDGMTVDELFCHVSKYLHHLKRMAHMSLFLLKGLKYLNRMVQNVS
jgi:RNA-directed DNA polymerase